MLIYAPFGELGDGKGKGFFGTYFGVDEIACISAFTPCGWLNFRLWRLRSKALKTDGDLL
jgi:hypothetical protein